MTTVHDPLLTEESGADVVGTATALLDAYRPDTDRFFASPTRTLLARGDGLPVPHDARPLTERVDDVLAQACAAGLPEPVVMGAIPFDASTPAALAVPGQVQRGPALGRDPLIALPAPKPQDITWDIRPVPEPDAYAAAVAAAVRRMAAGEFRKVVLARTLNLHADSVPDVPGMLQRLARRDPRGYTFAVPTGTGHTLLGASPELLVSRRGRSLLANPLAGSVPRSSDLAEDVRRAAALLESPKDLLEHAVVVSAISEALAPYCVDLAVPERPTLVKTAAMWHLSTTITGTLGTAPASALELACSLHPTPA
ncbi:chorismate-binding protein, partial [Streptomyces sp. NPDC056437]|uniref:chorismate-binding protein n=1 Tax=Streptomyces sp. NPDC056437 TaxID=3345816 RepID=UPI00369B7D05